MYSHNDIYQHDLRQIAATDLPWEQLRNKTVLITGASGLIGTFLVDLLMYRNRSFGDSISVLALGRNLQNLESRFDYPADQLQFVQHDITQPFITAQKIDFFIHAASNTHPIAYSTDPVGTITTNIFGTYNMLQYAAEHPETRCLLLSTVEIYGENRGDTDAFKEDYCGFIDCNSHRAGYPESKRTSEALCQSYIAKYGISVNIARLSRVYGPTMGTADSKAIAQFIRNALNKQDIVIKSDGKPFFSYCYMADAVSGLLTVMLCGKNGEAYNVSDRRSDATIRQLTETIGQISGCNVTFDIPNDAEKQGFSKVTKAIMDSSKLESLGWVALTDIRQGLEKTISILSFPNK